MAEKVLLKCNGCDAVKETTLTAKGTPKIQSQWGWKRRGEEVFCKECWRKMYVRRAIILPIRPVDPKQWPELRKVLAALWSQSTSLANWAIQQFDKHDTVRVSSQEKLPKLEPLAIYRVAVESYPDWSHWHGHTQAANAILRMAEKRWRRDRYAILWLCKQNRPTYRYGVPYPLDADAWRLSAVNDGYQLGATLGAARWTFHLAGGRRHWRQRRALKAIVGGAAIQVEAAIYERRMSLGDHRAGRAEASPGGGQHVAKRLFAKLVCWLPRQEAVVQQAHTLHVRTGKDVFWSAVLDAAEHAWTLHADHVNRWVMEYMVRLGKLSDDTKYEKRWPKRQRQNINSYREVLVTKHRRRVDAFIHQATAALLGYAQRNKVTEIVYKEDGYRFNPFPWHRLRETLRQKAEAADLTFTISASGEVVNETAETARET